MRAPISSTLMSRVGRGCIWRDLYIGSIDDREPVHGNIVYNVDVGVSDVLDIVGGRGCGRKLIHPCRGVPRDFFPFPFAERPAMSKLVVLML